MSQVPELFLCIVNDVGVYPIAVRGQQVWGMGEYSTPRIIVLTITPKCEYNDTSSTCNLHNELALSWNNSNNHGLSSGMTSVNSHSHEIMNNSNAIKLRNIAHL